MTVEQKAEEYIQGIEGDDYVIITDREERKQAFIDGYHECEKVHEEKCKTAYIKGIRTMANALKDYDRTDGAWTDYFEHTVDKVLNRLLKENE